MATLKRPLGRLVTVSLTWLLMPAAPATQVGVPSGARAGVQVVLADQDGRPAAAAEVALHDAAMRVVSRALSGPDGVARLLDVPPGTYELRVNGGAYDRVIRRVEVARGQIATVDLEVRRLASPGVRERRVPRNFDPGIEPAPDVYLPYAPGVPARLFGEPSPTLASKELAPGDRVFLAMPDRWNISLPDWDRYGRRGDYPYVGRHWWDPYNQNPLKGDYPIIGQQTFFVFTGVGDSLVEGRNLPTPAAPSSERPLSEPFFGRGDQYLPVQVFRLSFDLFRGDTAYRPVDWRVRVQPAISLNYLDIEEVGGVNIDVRRGSSRFDGHVGFQELFGEIKLFDLSANYDFVSLRAGIQELSTDFRGFLAVVEQPGMRLFGTLFDSRLEYNAAFFDFLEKDTNSAFNEWHRRKAQMFVANAYLQDFLTRGYTAQVSYHYSRDEASRHYDRNGFIVRPAPIGVVTPHEIRSHYLGWAGNGHIGRWNITHAFYQALGRDDFNPIAAQPADVNAQMAAVELSIDKDWLRLKGSAFFASGDDDVNDDEARGFDAILDLPVFAGGPFSIWNRQGVRLAQTLTGLVSPLSLLPTLRTNKDEGQQNFVNPGIFLVHGGVDVELTPRMRGFGNVSWLRFMHTEPLQALLFQAPIRSGIGVDFGGGVQYRPPLSDNIVVTGGVAAMKLGQGMRDIYTRDWFVSTFVNVRAQF
jgi:hypothetical protein